MLPKIFSDGVLLAVDDLKSTFFAELDNKNTVSIRAVELQGDPLTISPKGDFDGFLDAAMAGEPIFFEAEDFVFEINIGPKEDNVTTFMVRPHEVPDDLEEDLKQLPGGDIQIMMYEAGFITGLALLAFVIFAILVITFLIKVVIDEVKKRVPHSVVRCGSAKITL